MKKRTIFVGILLVIGIAAIVTAAVLFFTFPAKEYAKAVLDAQYKEQFDVYKKLTKASDKKMQEEYEKSISYQKEAWKEYLGVENLTKEGEKTIEDLVKIANNYLQYEVEDTDKKQASVKVHIKIRPLAVYRLIDREACMDAFRQKAEDGAYESLSQEQYEDAFAAFVCERYKKALEHAVYDKETSCTLTLDLEGDTYHASDTDLAKIDEALVKFEK